MKTETAILVTMTRDDILYSPSLYEILAAYPFYPPFYPHLGIDGQTITFIVPVADEPKIAAACKRAQEEQGSLEEVRK